MTLHTILFENNTLSIIDQTLLPQDLKIIRLDNFDKSIEAIKSLRVRGAPAIGIVAAYAVYLESKRLFDLGVLTKNSFESACLEIKASRPTAVNLFWAVDRMTDCFNQNFKSPLLINKLRECAITIHESDRLACEKIGKLGAPLLKDINNVLTHCNAGILATGGNGTALSVIYEAFKNNKKLHVFVDETRPLGQGARLTYFELRESNISCTLITDNTAASLFASKEIDAVIVGADRISFNGDFANKIGTYNLAVLAKVHKIPFYVAAPLSTFDRKILTGRDINIEIRPDSEVLSFWNISSKHDFRVYNPAFDITPGKLVNAFITESGIINKPFKTQINKLFKSKEI